MLIVYKQCLSHPVKYQNTDYRRTVAPAFWLAEVPQPVTDSSDSYSVWLGRADDIVLHQAISSDTLQNSDDGLCTAEETMSARDSDLLSANDSA